MSAQTVLDTESAESLDLALIPKPVRMVRLPGRFRLDPAARITVSPDMLAVGRLLQEMLKPATGYPLPVVEHNGGAAQPGAILLIADPTITHFEGYRLKVEPEGIIVRAAQPAGAFYGIQTLRQIFPAAIERRHEVRGKEWTLPSLRIEDAPRFGWRGLMLDTARHMYPVDFLKRFIDLLAMHKLNIFHWHLTDDQGWRIEINAYPRLTEVGSRRAASPLPSDPDTTDGTPYGGFYSREDIREVVAYAARRCVTVIPEIDMPGHCLAALAAYPELGCTGGPYTVPTRWGINADVYCAGNEQVYAFLEEVLTEVLELFPSRVIHIGGDEVPKDRWRRCPTCQAAITRAGLRDEEALQGSFVKRLGHFLQRNGRRLIGWDEILEGGLPPEALVMSWRGTGGGLTAAAGGHQVVMCPVSHCYFDYRQSPKKEEEPPAIGDEALTLATVYAFDPCPDTLPPQTARHIIGGQGNIWTEYIPTSAHVEYMAFPRATALAERLWSSATAYDFPDFSRRLAVFLDHLREAGIQFREPLA